MFSSTSTKYIYPLSDDGFAEFKIKLLNLLANLKIHGALEAREAISQLSFNISNPVGCYHDANNIMRKIPPITQIAFFEINPASILKKAIQFSEISLEYAEAEKKRREEETLINPSRN